MKIKCVTCENDKRFYLPLWIRATFRFSEDGTISVLHTRPLESIEEKIANNKVMHNIKCAACGSAAIATLASCEAGGAL